SVEVRAAATAAAPPAAPASAAALAAAIREATAAVSAAVRAVASVATLESVYVLAALVVAASSFTITQPSCPALQMNNCCPGAPFTFISISPSTQAFALPDAGTVPVVVFTGKVAPAPDRSTFAPLNVLLPVKLLLPLRVSLPLKVCGCVRMLVLALSV